MKDQKFKLMGVSKEEFLKWCKEKNLNPYISESSKLFFREIKNKKVDFKK